MANIQLYHYWRSSCSWRVRWALELKGVKVDAIPVNLLAGEQRSPAYLQMNPLGTVPMLVINGASYGQSLAILEWLDEVYPKPSLLPTDPIARMRTRQLSLMIVADTQPLQNLGAQRLHSADEEERKKWVQHWITQGLDAFERLVTTTAGTFAMGSQLTMADLCLVPQCYNAQRFAVDLKTFPTVHRIYQHCLTLPECDAAAPHRQQGATP